MPEAMNEQGRLELIESMIKKARNEYNESGTLYLMWGFVILICSFSQFVAGYYFQTNIGYIWMLTWVAVILQIVFMRKEKRRVRSTTYTSEIIGYIWIVFFICLMLIMFIHGYLKAYSSIMPSILVMYGVPTFLSGTIIRFNVLKYGGLCCWPLALLCTFTPLQFHVLYIAAAVIIAWIIPGLYLRKKYKSIKK